MKLQRQNERKPKEKAKKVEQRNIQAHLQFQQSK
jgi:hypothetical protein